MFCPNCGSKNGVNQNYCRGCGLKLDTIVEAVADQFPSKEFVELQRRKERFEKLGVAALSIAGLIGFSILLFKAAQYKLVLFGPDILFGSAMAALIGFLLLSVLLFNYPKFFLKGKSRPRDENRPSAVVTARLIEDRPSDYVSSVTEGTTEFLHASSSRSNDDEE